MSREGDLRRHERAEASSPARIVWQHRGEDRVVNARVLNVSASGIRLEVAEPLDRQTYVTVQCDPLGVHGRASVRTCTRKGMKYILGLEFSGGLLWKPKKETKPPS